jgi:hypothetical protein
LQWHRRRLVVDRGDILAHHWTTRWILDRPREAFELLRRTTPWLVGVFLAAMMAKIGGQCWSEHRPTADGLAAMIRKRYVRIDGRDRLLTVAVL